MDFKNKAFSKKTFTVLIRREMFYWLLYFRIFERKVSGQIWKLGAIVYSFHRECTTTAPAPATAPAPPPAPSPTPGEVYKPRCGGGVHQTSGAHQTVLRVSASGDLVCIYSTVLGR